MAPLSPNTTHTFKIHKAQKLAHFRTHQANGIERHRAANDKYLTGALTPTTIPPNSHGTDSSPLNYGSSVRAVSDTTFVNGFPTPIWDNTTIPSSLVPILEGDAFDKGKANCTYALPHPSCILTDDDLSEAYRHMHTTHINRLSNIEVVRHIRDSASENNPADTTPLQSPSPSPSPSSQPHYTTKILYTSSSTDQPFTPSSSPSSHTASSPATRVRALAPVPLSLASPPPSPTSPCFDRSSLPLPLCRYSNRVYTGLNTQLRRRFHSHYPYAALSSSSSSSPLSSSSSSSTSTMPPPLTIKSLQLGNSDGSSLRSASTLRTLLTDYDSAFTRWDAAMCANERRGMREFQGYMDKDILTRADACLRGPMARVDKKRKEKEMERRKRKWKRKRDRNRNRDRNRDRKEKRKGKRKERFTRDSLSGMSRGKSKSASRSRSMLTMLTEAMEWDIWGRRRWYLLRNLDG